MVARYAPLPIESAEAIGREKTEMASRWLRAWGEATAFLRGSRRPTLADLVVVGALGGLAFAVARVAHGWAGELRPAVEIDLSPRALPGYALLSLSRGLVAYLFSFLFTLGYGSWAAHDRRAERVLVPLLDVLQSVPVLGFMPGLVLALAIVSVLRPSTTNAMIAIAVVIIPGNSRIVRGAVLSATIMAPHEPMNGGFCMPYWIVTTEGSPVEPPGTRKVLRRVLLDDARIRWLVEGASFIGVLPEMIGGIISVVRVAPPAAEDGSMPGKW